MKPPEHEEDAICERRKAQMRIAKSHLRVANAGAVALALLGALGSHALAASPVTITYAYWDTTVTPAFQAAADEFHKDNPDITVELRTVPFSDYFTKLNTQLPSGTAPDAFWLQNIQFPLYQQNGVLADLTPFKQASSIDLSGIDANLMNPYVVDGKLYAIPWQSLPFGLYYNKAMFDKAGVAEPTNDWTWADVEKAAAALTDKAAGTYGILAPLWNYGDFYQTMYGYGAKVITKDGKDTDFDSPEAVRGISIWTNFSQKGYSPSVTQLADGDFTQWFTSGKAAMMTSGSWPVQGFQKVLGDAVKVVQMPKGTVDTSAYATTTSAVAASSQHIAEAYKWAEFLASEKGQLVLNSNSAGGTGAPVNAQANAAWIATAPGVGLENLLAELPKATLLPATKNTLAWESELTPTLAPAYEGKESVQDAASQMAQIIRGKLALE
jgi:multiple sugar transport system substrate-binding protein